MIHLFYILEEGSLAYQVYKGPMPGTCVFPYSYAFFIRFARIVLIRPCKRCADRTHRSHEDMATEGNDVVNYTHMVNAPIGKLRQAPTKSQTYLIRHLELLHCR